MTEHGTRASQPLAWRVWTLVLVLLVAAATSHASVLSDTQDPRRGVSWTWIALTVAFALAEICVVHVRWGGEAHTFGFSEIPLVAGLLLASPNELVTARLVGAGLTLALYRRQSLVKLAFNLSQWWLATVLALVIWQHLGDPSAHYSSQSWVAAVSAAMVADLVGTIAVTAAIALRGAHVDAWHAWGTAWTGAATAFANACFGLVILDVLHVNWRGSWALVAVAVFLGFAQRAHVVLQRRHDSLERLSDFSAGLSTRFEVDGVVDEILRGAGALVNAGSTELWLHASFMGAGVLYRRQDGQLHKLNGGSSTPLPGESAALRRWSPGWRRPAELTVHLRDATEVLGALTVRGRLGDVGMFDRDDLRMLHGLGRHASAALANSRLADQLRDQVHENEFQALHDALTGLANRVLFERRLQQAVSAGPVGVMLLDLDRFKEVNDTLGHAVGDDLLREAGARIAAAVPHAAMVARLGGDEFALILGASSVADMREQANAVRDALLHPIAIPGITLSIDASIGIAHAPAHGQDTSLLLRHADVAMYRAKQARSGVEVYSPAEDDHSSSRLALVTELREAIKHEQLQLFYQPKADLFTGAVTSVEALVRWHHPERGLVSPDEFIPIAEQTGLINPLTDWVVQEALIQCNRWRQAGMELSVAVNVSPRSLRDEAFPDVIRRGLVRHHVPPASLTLEITESAILEDPVRAGGVLRELRTLGVRISVDDFGTGYSSLANLKHLPVDEVKIDRSFISNLLEDRQDAAIVCAVVQLVHQLGMHVVAEGVETPDTWQWLQQIGCDTAQGYLISRPVEARSLPEFLDAWIGPSLPVAAPRDLAPVRRHGWVPRPREPLQEAFDADSS
jgi:diguanylate cyclase (GGDEF)-like protein